MRLKALHKLQFVICLLAMLLWMFAGSFQLAASAAEGDGSLTLLCKTTEEVILEGMHWDIYRVGGRTDDGSYELQGDFAAYPVSLEDTSASALSAAAETLETYAVLDAIAPLASGEADAYGYLKFPLLAPGLYLVSGDYLQIGNTYYFPSAFLVEIPAEGDAVVDFLAYPKYISMNAGEGELDYTVKKIWENDETEPENRSVYITVEIYRDEVLHETITLDESNDWTYSWTADQFYDWRVLEVDVPEGYDVVYRSNETQYVIVNTYTDSSSVTETQVSTDSEMTDTTASGDTQVTETLPEETNMTETVPETDVTESDATETQSTAQSSTTTTTVTTTETTPGDDGEDLPQTGQLWWPVPVLGVAGLLSVAIGLRLRTKE